MTISRFHPSSDKMLAAGNGSWLEVWQLEVRAEPLLLFESQELYTWVNDAVFVDGGNAIVAACGLNGLNVHPLSPMSKLKSARIDLPGGLERLGTCNAGNVIIGLTQNHHRSPDHQLRGYHCWTLREHEYSEHWCESLGIVYGSGIAIHPDEQRFAASETSSEAIGEFESTIEVREIANGERVETYRCPFGWGAHDILFSPTGQSFVAMREMSLYTWRTGMMSAPPMKLLNDNRKHFTGIAYHPSGRYLAATSNDTTVKLYDTVTWTVAKIYHWNVGKLRSVAFSPDGSLGAVGSDKWQIVVWDVDL